MQATNAKTDDAIGAAKVRKSTRVIRNETQWMAIFEAQRASGLTAEKFCIAHKISRSGYWKWNKLLCEKKKASAIKGVAPSHRGSSRPAKSSQVRSAQLLPQ